MLNPHDLVELYKIATMASTFSKEDFRKAVESDVVKYEAKEAAHKEKLLRMTEIQKQEIQRLRQNVLDDENRVKLIEQANNKAAEKLAQERTEFAAKCKEREAVLNKQELTLHNAVEAQKRQDKNTAERLADVIQREKRAEEMEQQYLADHRALKERLDKLRAITA